jgi:competence protein ComEC
MKVPALWIVVAFATGVAIATRRPEPLWFTTFVCALAILIGIPLVSFRRIAFAAVFALIAWVALGSAAVAIERADVPANHVTRLISAGRLDLTEPLRWRGRLREDPLAFPWGHRFEIDLEQVEVNDSYVPVTGGLRLNLYGSEDSHAFGSAPQILRAGDRVEALAKARPPRNFEDPGAFDLRGYLARQKIDLTGSLRSGELLQLVDRPAPTLLQRLARVRGDLLARIDYMFPGDSGKAAVLRAMLLGDRSFVDSQAVEAFQKTAAYHVLVVAGLHVGALIAFLFWLCRRLRLSVTVTSLVTLLVLAAYVGVVQDRPPILLAALMAALYLCARPLFRRVDLVNTVALAALVILIWKPSSFVDSSFQLSFLAAGVIAGLAIPWMERSSAAYRAGLRHLGDVTRDNAFPPRIAQFRIELRAATKWLASHVPQNIGPRSGSILIFPTRAGLRLWEIVLLSVVIQWGMAPLMAQDFHRVSLAGPISNIPAVVLTGIIVPIGFLALAFAFLWARAGLFLARLLGFCVTLLVNTVEWFSRLPHLSYRIPDPPIWLVAAFVAAFALLAAAARRAAFRRGAGRIARRQSPPPVTTMEWGSGIALAALTILIAWHPFAPRLQHGKLEATVLDVGQGDSIFAAFPDGRIMLIDGGGLSGSEWVGGYRSGNDVGEEVVSPYLWSRGLKKIDVVALSHAHHDHIDGLHAILQNFRVSELWIGRDEDTPALKGLLAEARERGVKVVHKVSGENLNFGGVGTEILWPPDVGPERGASNDDSLVIRFSDGALRFLLPGDIERGVEQQLINQNAALAADFLKVPHHGSKTSSIEPFLASVHPQIAAVSVGAENPFGHPYQGVIDRYHNDGVRLFRTDRDGAITAITDGQSLWVSSYAH